VTTPTTIQLDDAIRAAAEPTVLADVRAALADSPSTAGPRHLITAASARAIAFWWQSPGAVGHVLASFASGVAVQRADLLEDIARSRGTDGVTEGQLGELDALAAFVEEYAVIA